MHARACTARAQSRIWPIIARARALVLHTNIAVYTYILNFSTGTRTVGILVLRVVVGVQRATPVVPLALRAHVWQPYSCTVLKFSTEVE